MSRFRTDGQLVDGWHHVFRVGPCALLDALLDEVSPALDSKTRAIVTRLTDGWRDEIEWVTKARQELIGEAGRVQEIGKVMRAAGLRSYTDKEGRIYVAATEYAGDVHMPQARMDQQDGAVSRLPSAAEANGAGCKV